MKDADEKERSLLKNFEQYECINQDWHLFMLSCHEMPNVMFQSQKDSIYTTLRDNNKRFEELFKGLENFFDEKRKDF